MRAILTSLLIAVFGLTTIAPGGAQTGMTGETVICPTCGHVMPGSFNFCSNCGTNLENVPRISTGPAPTKTEAAKKKEKSGFFDLFSTGPRASAHGSSALSDKPIPLKLEGFPERPKPIIEIGQNPFLGKGPIAPGFTIPTGAVWQPVFIVFGTARTALQTFDNGTGQVTDWASRLDLYGNLYLTPTERLLIGFRPLDRDGLDYSGYRFDPPPQRLKNDLNAYVTTLFFQGDFGEIFPNLDPNDTKSLDYSFAIGRQPLSFEDGIMINEDVIDAIGITRTSLFALGASSLRTTGIFAWGELNRNDNLRDNSARLFGLFTTADYAADTVDLDLAYVNADDYTGGDGFYIGVGDTRRFGLINSTTRVNASIALDRETPAVSNGVLLFQQFSTTLPESKDIVYLDAFWGIANYSSAARGGDRGGPLGDTGILFAAQGLGSYGAPLGNRANDAVGAAVGYQKFLGGTDKQITFELGGRVATQDPKFFGPSQPNAVAGAVRYQMKLNQHLVLIFDNFVGFPEDRATAYGFRSEILVKF
ncbi:MAG: zinc ribbon domain-containing protein [Chthoniobacterales bacterium]